MLNAKIKKIELISDTSSRTILSDINFTLEDNKIFSVLGKNGTGKSTLIKSLTGLLDNHFYKTEGIVMFSGIDLLSAGYNEIVEIRKHKIKYIFQDAVNSFDPLKKINYYFKRTNRNTIDIDKLLEYFLLPDSKMLYAMYPYEVSGGMAQRISLVLALLAEPEILILDEPTSGIDAPMANLIMLKLKEFITENNNSVLLVTQDLFFAEKASDRIAYISDGTLTKFYSPNEIISSEMNKLNPGTKPQDKTDE